MLKKIQKERFLELRKRLFSCIDFENKLSSGYHKSMEGTLSISYYYKSYFGEELIEPWFIYLSSYLLCDGREETFKGKTFEACLDKFEGFIEGCEDGQKKVRERGIT